MSRIPPLVVDANVLISATLKDGTTRRLLMDPRLRLCAPEHLWVGAMASRDEWLARGGFSPTPLEALWDALQARIVEVPPSLVRRRHSEAVERLSGGDRTDAPYLAAALVVNGVIWTHDKGFRKRAGLPTISTAEVVAALSEAFDEVSRPPRSRRSRPA